MGLAFSQQSGQSSQAMMASSCMRSSLQDHCRLTTSTSQTCLSGQMLGQDTAFGGTVI
jgi:hypothetical protein